MTAIEKLTKFVQIDAFKNQTEISEDKIYAKLKENFEPRVKYLFARLGQIQADYEEIIKQCAFLYDELEAAKDAFVATNIRMKTIEIRLDAKNRH